MTAVNHFSIKQFLSIAFCLMLSGFSVLTAQQSSFPYSVELREVSIPGLPGFHSFAYGQHDGKWLIVGGRTDGIHARQPFASFPPNHNNEYLFAIDPSTGEFSAEKPVGLSVGIREHLQSTNMNFQQVGDTLYIIGGYAFSESAGDHITFPKLTAIVVSEAIQQIEEGRLTDEIFGHLYDERFAVTGGQLGFIDGKLILVGGHRFDGQYNPRNMPTFRQEYTHAIQIFNIETAISDPQISFYERVVDEEHLRRRDYNLVPYLFPDGEPGYMISTGVFQRGADLPFLYNVEVGKEGFYRPVPEFDQLLSHYHSPKLSLYEQASGRFHMLFFGGLAQFYFQGDQLIQDDRVPFVNTISRVTRDANGVFSEYALALEMPGLKGTSAEFIPNPGIPKNETGVILENSIMESRFLAGHIVGGIDSPVRNPFATNQTQVTSASYTVYEVWLERGGSAEIPVDSHGNSDTQLHPNYPNPFSESTTIHFTIGQDSRVQLDLFSVQGSKIATILSAQMNQGTHQLQFDSGNLASGLYLLRMSAEGVIRNRAILLSRAD
ncbi:MAG: T9SS C-terminal target domain-containing protein [Balneolaceae bacterium]|nr:MAG: T9SS C-terminal target domain-containing protein [Balneolaceae bacterium]